MLKLAYLAHDQVLIITLCISMSRVEIGRIIVTRFFK